MIKILGKKGQYHSVTTGENNKVLNSTETEKTRQSILKNIIATMGQFRSPWVYVLDESDNSKFDYYIEEKKEVLKVRKGSTPIFKDGIITVTDKELQEFLSHKTLVLKSLNHLL